MNEWIGQVLPFWKDLTETEKQMLLTHTALEEYEKEFLYRMLYGSQKIRNEKNSADPR